MATTLPTIYLTAKKTGIAAYREKKTIGGRVVKFLTSWKTTVGLATTAAALLTGGAAVAAGRVVAGRVIAKTVAKKAVRKISKSAARRAAKAAARRAAKAAGKVGVGILKAAAKKPALAIVGAGVLVSGAAPTIVKTLFKAGKVSGEVITGERALTSETVADVAKGLGVAVGLGAAGVAVGAVAKKIMTKKEEAALVGAPTMGLEAAAPQQLITEKPIGVKGEAPITPLTTDITKEKRPYRARRATKAPSVKQSVKINIISRPIATGMRITNKRYLNQELLV